MGAPSALSSTKRVARRVLCPSSFRALIQEGQRNGEHMKFPETSRKGDPSHLSAIDRLACARDEQRRLAGEAHAAQGSSAQDATESHLSEAKADVAAREAWLGWIEGGV
jgi:hypothetical protein